MFDEPTTSETLAAVLKGELNLDGRGARNREWLMICCPKGIRSGLLMAAA
jgi:hypothetical protein